MRYREVLIFFLVVALASTLSILTSEPTVYEAQAATQPKPNYFEEINGDRAALKPDVPAPELAESVVVKPRFESEAKTDWLPTMELHSFEGEDWNSRKFYCTVKAGDGNWTLNTADPWMRLTINDKLGLAVSKLTDEGDGRYSFVLSQITPENLTKLKQLGDFKAELSMTMIDPSENVYSRRMSTITVASDPKHFEAL